MRVPSPPSPDSSLPLDLVDPETGHPIYPCKACRIVFKKKLELKTHYRAAHPGYKAYKCNLCKKRYQSEDIVRLHQKNHHKQRRYVCEWCDKDFATEGQMKVHLMTAKYCPGSSNYSQSGLDKKMNSDAPVWNGMTYREKLRLSALERSRRKQLAKEALEKEIEELREKTGKVAKVMRKDKPVAKVIGDDKPEIVAEVVRKAKPEEVLQVMGKDKPTKVVVMPLRKDNPDKAFLVIREDKHEMVMKVTDLV